jgi:hypothetical protein
MSQARGGSGVESVGPPQAAVDTQPGCPLLSWDSELIARGGALSPRDWLAANP